MGYIKRFLVDQWPLWIEGLGTLLLVLVGTSVVTAMGVSGQATSASVILLNIIAFSLTYGWLVYAFGNISGGHFNPAISTLALFRGELSFVRWSSYIVVQSVGAVVASVIVALLYGTPGAEAKLGAPFPATEMGPISALIAEALGTMVLLIAVTKANQSQRSRISIGSMTGLGLGLGMLLSAGVSGGALNPARAIGPELVAADTANAWIYWAGPLAAVLLVSGWQNLFRSAAEYQEPAHHPGPGPSPTPARLHTSLPPQPNFQMGQANADLQQKVHQAEQQLEVEPEIIQPTPRPQPAQPTFQPDMTNIPEIEEREPEPEQVVQPISAPTPPPSAPSRPGPVKFVDFERTGEE